ncbi:MAG TPA: peroxiredoxin [Leptospiraceae bacterium]|nr:peroxiredoxin [Leptospiraceae bacterium]HMW05121.1 peroxiredoxin [Leptospiraceae bacterium]HMX31375.1 peroxiredoxin [Leptospiraceae bacterium]HMY31582.1 peroxiredoxin [Leptospiraceae bacterium]HMZ66678.1 peroxiredoxin [Leptospiraceae bacterium]
MSLLNEKAPDFTLPNSEGELIALSSFKGKKLLLVFYPGDETMVCTKQLCSYSSGFEDFQKLGIDIIGINMDSVESHKKFKEKYKLAFPLLSDSSGSVCEKYNAKGLLGVKRSTFLLDENQTIIFENEVLPVFYKDKDEVLTEIKKLA